MNAHLSAGLADLAGQVRNVDLSDRVRAGSRRRRARRQVLAGIVVLALVVVGGLAAWGVQRAAPPAAVAGSVVVSTTDDAGRVTLWRVDATGAAIDLLTVDGPIASVSPGGRWVAWWETRADATVLFAADLDDGTPIEVARYETGATFCHRPQWAPDGRPWLLATNPRSLSDGIHMVNVDTGVPSATLSESFLDGRDPCAAAPAGTEEGYRLLWWERDGAGARIIAVDVNRVRHDDIVFGALGASIDAASSIVAASPSATLLCFGSDPSPSDGACVAIVDVTTRSVVDAGPDAARGLVGDAHWWCADGDRLVIVALDSGEELSITIPADLVEGEVLAVS